MELSGPSWKAPRTRSPPPALRAYGSDHVREPHKQPVNDPTGSGPNNLIKIWPALWTFLTIEGVTPTNNAAERALRGPVIHHKLSYGNQSDDGERFTERSLSASVTCRLQHRSLLPYLTQLFTAHQTDGALPTLT